MADLCFQCLDLCYTMNAFLLWFSAVPGMLRRLVSLSSCREILWNFNSYFSVGIKRQIHRGRQFLAAASDLDMEHLQNNPYYAKYAARLKQVQE